MTITETNYKNISHEPFDNLSNGDTVYCDDARKEGYQIVTAKDAPAISVGDMIPVGSYGDVRRVTGIGKQYLMGDAEGNRVAVRRLYFAEQETAPARTAHRGWATATYYYDGHRSRRCFLLADGKIGWSNPFTRHDVAASGSYDYQVLVSVDEARVILGAIDSDPVLAATLRNAIETSKLGWI